MANPAAAVGERSAPRDHGFHSLQIMRVIEETADARSFVLRVHDDLGEVFRYAPGQFCTFRVDVDGQSLVRCYSMSSSPAVDADLQVTVKRVPGGAVSNWMNDALAAGDEIDVAPPAGFFQLRPGEGDIVAFGAGSGITPVFSLLKTALATSGRKVRLLYANRDSGSVIFGREIGDLAAEHAARFSVLHRLDVEHGFVNGDVVRGVVEEAGGAAQADFYICGPGPFMDVVEHTLLEAGATPDRIHIERFTSTDLPRPEERVKPEVGEIRVTVALGGRTDTTVHRPGTTLLQAARQLGMSPPFSCESGSCASCMAKLLEGRATMRVNNALTADEVADGWVLTCQALPTSPSVHVTYEET
jgi:3-ketosteroid 9alpha-monooxygenase subunit B